jgi:hypothetical protein
VLEVRKNRLRYAGFAFVSLLFGIASSVALNLSVSCLLCLVCLYIGKNR